MNDGWLGPFTLSRVPELRGHDGCFSNAGNQQGRKDMSWIKDLQAWKELIP
jgi:hypothetical protein